MSTTTSTNFGSGEAPVPVRRSADLLVLVLLAVALFFGWKLRHATLSASETVAVPGTPLSLIIPARSIATPGGQDLYAVATPSGLSVRVSARPLPPIGADVLGLLTFRAKDLGEQGGVFKSLSTQVSDDHKTGVIEYQYVRPDSGSAFAGGLRLMHGYEILIPSGETVYYIAMEAPDNHFNEVEARWSAFVKGIRLSEGK